MKKILAFAVLFAAVCIIVCAVVFLPRHSVYSLTACDLTGNTVNIDIDITCRRRLFKSESYTGTLTVDGKEYLSVDRIDGFYRDGQQHQTQGMLFALPSEDIDFTRANGVTVIEFEKGKYIINIVSAETAAASNLRMLFAPAGTADQARQIMQDYQSSRE